MAGSESVLDKFGKRLKKCRIQAGISQEELAARASLDRTYISLLERGQRNPTLSCVHTLAAALDITLSDLCEF
jgi:transcriptional regulator with XRE-family HTH domain